VCLRVTRVGDRCLLSCIIVGVVNGIICTSLRSAKNTQSSKMTHRNQKQKKTTYYDDYVHAIHRTIFVNEALDPKIRMLRPPRYRVTGSGRRCSKLRTYICFLRYVLTIHATSSGEGSEPFV
jgi:hypothetical protein